jgi:hypothetical protein
MKRYGFSLIVLLSISFYAFPQGEHLKVVDNWFKYTDVKSSLYNYYLCPVLLHATAIVDVSY